MDQSGKVAERQAKQARLGRALRENLQRRKAQMRSRAEEAAASGNQGEPEPADTRLSPQSRPD
jgi:hypothetical protein